MDGFRGTDRYTVVRRLGGGGMGIVYEVQDAERDGHRVALKTLRDHDAQALMRLKREFRSLADVRHQNLVALYELVADGDSCFFTLELVDGVDFHSWLRPAAPALKELPTAELEQTMINSRGPAGSVDLGRLRAAFSQLAAGVHAVHTHGRLHRDLKPSNVLVTPEGRVVILDFGLVAELAGAESVSEAAGKAIVGTATYMAPEQAMSGPVTAASDWYAFGVMLFQALTGRVPFDGPAMQVIVDKQRRPAPSPRDLDAAVPEELDALCTRLLRREPTERPGIDEISRAFGAPTPAARPSTRVEADFVGREPELAALRAALARSREAVPVVVRVLGSSGIGKSALIRRFLADAEREGAVVLSGRCYERETVPFKALDAVIDALARHLSAQASDKVDVLLPRDAHALAGMFPVLQRVPAFRGAPTRPSVDAAEQRRRAAFALRELVLRMSDRSPVVVVIDDAQWGDLDSAIVLEEVLQPPEAPGVLVIVSSRADAMPLNRVQVDSTVLRLEPLGQDERRALALRATRGDAERAQVVSDESAGNPFLLLQLAEHGSRGGARMEDVVLSRLAGLTTSARRLLDVVVVAGSPLLEKVAAKVARLEPGDLDSAQTLKAAHLVRGIGEGPRLESWHDRIREAVAGLVDAGRALEIHARLAEALQDLPEVDVDTVAWHLTASGQIEKAAEATLSAAKRASSLLAFDRAAVLFGRVLELVSATDLRRRTIAVARADSLADAGRGPEAADAYQRAAQERSDHPLSEGESLELKRRAAEQLLRSGRIDEGLDAIRDVLSKVGMALPETPVGAGVGWLVRRIQIRARGLAFVSRRGEEIPELTLRKIDVCWSVASGLSLVDVIRGANFNSKHLLFALRAGEPTRVARALAVEAAYLATKGRSTEKQVTALFHRALALAEQIGDQRLIGLVEICGGLNRFLVGQWREAKALSARAEQRFADLGSAVSWEAATARITLVWNHFFLGEFAELSRRVPVLLREATLRGDRYAATSLQVGLANMTYLARGDSQQARAVEREAIGAWSSRTFQFPHYWALLSETFIDLYDGVPLAAWTRLEAAWPDLARAQLLQIQNVRVEALTLKGRVAMALGKRSVVQDIIDRLEGEKVAYAQAFAAAFRAQLPGATSAHGRDAVARMEGADMALFAKVARYRLSRQDQALTVEGEEAVAWMRAQGIADPERMSEMLIPSFPREKRLLSSAPRRS